MKSLFVSASVLVLAFSARADAAGPTAPNFGQPAGLMAVSASPAPLAASGIAVPSSLSGSAPGAARAPVVPGVNPFAAPAPAVAAPAPALAPAAELRGSVAPPASAPQAPAAAAAPGFQPDAPPAQDAAAAPADAKDKVDEAALRYYASSRDLVRVGAEIRRLKALHPDWQPPTDLFAERTTVDESDLWALFSKNDYAGLDAAIAARTKATPGWKPTADLAAKIAAGRGRAEITRAASLGDWNGVVAAAGKNPGVLTCGNMDLLWSLGEGYARLQNFARSFDLYAYVLKTCDNPAERVATYQKASALLPPEGAEALAGFGRPLPNGSTEFAAVQFDPLRTGMGKIAAGEPAAALDPAELQAFAAEIGRSRSQGDALLFAWYLYAQKDFAGAAEWFKAAAQLGSDPKAVEGYILSLRNGGHLDDAMSVAFANRALSPEITKVYVEIVSSKLTENNASAVIDDQTVQTFASVVEEARSALGAQSLGWNLLAHDEVDAAREWFTRSVEWQPTKEGVTGLAVVAARSKNKNELKLVKERFGDNFPLLASFRESAPVVRRSAPAKAAQPASAKPAAGAKSGGAGGDGSMMAEANAAFKAGDYKRTLAILEKRKATYGANGGAEILRGWTNLKLGRYEEARRVFKDENKRNSTKDSRFGIGAVSNQQYNMWE